MSKEELITSEGVVKRLSGCQGPRRARKRPRGIAYTAGKNAASSACKDHCR